MPAGHNPIAELVHQTQKKWMDEVSPHPQFTLVRWLIKPAEARLFEGFLKLESTEHGALPEVLITMLSSFGDKDGYSSTIIKDWGEAFIQDTKTHEKIQAKGKTIMWSPESFIRRAADSEENKDEL